MSEDDGVILKGALRRSLAPLVGSCGIAQHPVADPEARQGSLSRA
jgi:hypothetical protein